MKRQGVNYDPLKEIMVTVGGSEAIDVALRCMLNPGDEVIIPEPCYVSYVPWTKMADGVPVFVECAESNNFEPRIEDLKAAIFQS